MEKDKSYVGDLELSTNSHYLGININILTKSGLCYKSYLSFESLININEIINILYCYGNHYILLIKRVNRQFYSGKKETQIDSIINFKNKKIKINKNKINRK